MMVREQLLVAEVDSNLNVQMQPQPMPPCGPLEKASCSLRLGMVWCHARSNQPERRRKSIEHLHFDRDILAIQQVFGGVEASWTGTDDGDP
jgi:hypothetical protein